jgi:hypothetical protein
MLFSPIYLANAQRDFYKISKIHKEKINLIAILSNPKLFISFTQVCASNKTI